MRTDDELRTRLRSLVRQASPPEPVIDAIASRGRRRRVARRIGVSVPIVLFVVGLAASLIALSGVGHRSTRTQPAAGDVFPGGGRILFADSTGLQWMAPDGTTTLIGGGFVGARLTPDGSSLLAWTPTDTPGTSRSQCPTCSYDVDYYTMGLDGSNAKLILAAEAPVGSKEIHHLDVQLSPDGLGLAYARQEDLPNGDVAADELWSVDLATGTKTDLGPVPSSDLAFVWKDSSTIVAQSADGAALQSVDVATGTRSPLMSSDDSRLIRAFEQARPGAGRPTQICPLGWSTDPAQSAMGVYLIAANGQTAVALVNGDNVRASTPDDRYDLSFTWGPDGYFEITSFSGDNATAGAGAFVGNVSGSGLQSIPTLGRPDAATFDPGGRYVALEYQGGTWSFTRTPPADCLAGGACPSPSSVTMNSSGRHLQDWAS